MNPKTTLVKDTLKNDLIDLSTFKTEPKTRFYCKEYGIYVSFCALKKTKGCQECGM